MQRHPETAAVRRRLTSPVVLLSALLVLALVAWLSFPYVRDWLAGSGCDAPAPVEIAAAPDIAPVLAEVARTLPERAGPGCVRVTVTSADSAGTAESLARGAGGPDVWVPESSLWLPRARDLGAWDVPESGQPVASSPVVLALADDAADRLGWPGQAPTWPQVLGAASVGLSDPGRDPVAVAALLGVKELTVGTADPSATLTAGLRKLTTHVVAGPEELFPRQDGKPSFSAFPASERAVITHNAASGENKFVAVYPDVPVPSLDYPFVLLPKASEAARAGAEGLLRELLQPGAAQAFAAAGFRSPEGQVLGVRPRDGRTNTASLPVRPPAQDATDAILQVWAGVNLSARVQVLLDVSGSMSAVGPGTTQSRMQLTVRAATQGMGLFKPTTELGLWLFSTELDGDKDYRELLP
ncbi:MAG: substrate-binding and VWA domain-containing protein, partial [Actinomycetota bacterium]|nr:substrate-binding and VWA domain-containing protein [Actinomycetota bacterium]